MQKVANTMEIFKETEMFPYPVCASGMCIPDPNFFHPESRIQGQKDSRIPDPVPHPHERIEVF